MTVGICEPVSRLSCPFQREKKGETQNNNNNNNNRWWVWYNNNKGAALLATREKETKSSKKGSSLYLSFFFKCPVFCFVFFLLCCWNSSNWVCNESLFEKNKTGVIDFYIFFVLFFFYFPVGCERMKYHLEFRADLFRTRTKRFTHRHVWIARLEHFFFLPTFVRVTTNEYGNLYF